MHKNIGFIEIAVKKKKEYYIGNKFLRIFVTGFLGFQYKWKLSFV